MIILDVNKVSKNFGYGTLFQDLSFSLNGGERISIVGHNGSGKSTLLKMLAGIEKPTSGTISIKKDAKISYLDQTTSDQTDDRNVKEILKDAFANLIVLEKKMETLTLKMQETVDEARSQKLIEEYTKVFEFFMQEGGYDIDLNINMVCGGLKISEKMLDQKYNSLSGGEKTLVQLAKVLLIKPDLLLLDEPTNHLDISRMEWLEKYIKKFNGALVTVSHDRYFLDIISNKILEIENGETQIYNTNYSNYLIEKEKNLQKLLENFKYQQEYISRLEQQIKYFSERGMATNSSTLCNRAKSLQTQLDRFKERAIQKPKEQRKLKLNFNELSKSSKVICEVENLSVSAPQKVILKNVDISIRSGERVALIGDNGAGKSTFVQSILGTTNLQVEGKIVIGNNIKIGYLPQIINFEADSKKNILEYFKNEACLNEEKARSTLASFLFDKQDLSKKITTLSGGEKIRLKLAILLQENVNVLIFDEPTNHIDIQTKETLENAIENFGGTLIFVSHDRFLINKFAEKIYEFKDGKIKCYIGNFDDYKKEVAAKNE